MGPVFLFQGRFKAVSDEGISAFVCKLLKLRLMRKFTACIDVNVAFALLLNLMDSITVELYALSSGKEPYTEWKRRLSKDTLAVITARIARLRNGNFGTCKPVGGGVYELKIYYGPGYRIYYGKKGETLTGRIVWEIKQGGKHEKI
ncbi:MAG TPA: type II toxin-antitoxin system RelE/ParE family toxin [Rhabdochlamydiaceae bacterium]|nr:type II toxin-antitoxin system RelE/ParE family toxin [Rhabdochlamydiaceae bacterium]